MTRRIGHILASLVITPIGAVFGLVLFFFFSVGVLQALITELVCCGMRLFQSKTFPHKAIFKEAEFYMSEAEKAA